MDEIITEFAIWFISVVISFIVLNRYVYIKTAASIVLSLFIASVIIYIIYTDLFAEIALSVSVIIVFIYGIFATLRDKRTDIDDKIG